MIDNVKESEDESEFITHKSKSEFIDAGSKKMYVSAFYYYMKYDNGKSEFKDASDSINACDIRRLARLSVNLLLTIILFFFRSCNI